MKKKKDSLFLSIRHFIYRGQTGYIILMDRRIVGPSWIWTSVDISPTNLQSVPINRSGIDPGRINSRLIDNPWSTPFRLTPRGSRIPAASLKERCPEPLDDGGILARLPSYYDHSMISFLKLSIEYKYNGLIWCNSKDFAFFHYSIEIFLFVISIYESFILITIPHIILYRTSFI